jgi:hypothetical protein
MHVATTDLFLVGASFAVIFRRPDFLTHACLLTAAAWVAARGPAFKCVDQAVLRAVGDFRLAGFGDDVERASLATEMGLHLDRGDPGQATRAARAIARGLGRESAEFTIDRALLRVALFGLLQGRAGLAAVRLNRGSSALTVARATAARRTARAPSLVNRISPGRGDAVDRARIGVASLPLRSHAACATAELGNLCGRAATSVVTTAAGDGAIAPRGPVVLRAIDRAGLDVALAGFALSARARPAPLGCAID